MSGLRYTTRINPGNILTAGAHLYLNPYASRPYSGALTKLPTSLPAQDRYTDLDGRAIQQLLSIDKEVSPVGWGRKPAALR